MPSVASLTRVRFKTRLQQWIEAEAGRPIEEVLLQQLRRGGIYAAAERLEVHPSTISRWCTSLGIVHRGGRWEAS